MTENTLLRGIISFSSLLHRSHCQKLSTLALSQQAMMKRWLILALELSFFHPALSVSPNSILQPYIQSFYLQNFSTLKWRNLSGLGLMSCVQNWCDKVKTLILLSISVLIFWPKINLLLFLYQNIKQEEQLLVTTSFIIIKFHLSKMQPIFVDSHLSCLARYQKRLWEC